jgi:uncharacterized protein (DUF1499 family)
MEIHCQDFSEAVTEIYELNIPLLRYDFRRHQMRQSRFTKAIAQLTVNWRQLMGLFSGTRPKNLGYTSGKFAPPTWKPNTVCSTIEKSDKHFIDPLTFSGLASASWKKLRAIVGHAKGATIITDREDYLYVEYSSGLFGFVDDVEFAIDEKVGVIQVRSASRLGIDDLGVNRKRIELIRAKLSAI